MRAGDRRGHSRSPIATPEVVGVPRQTGGGSEDQLVRPQARDNPPEQGDHVGRQQDCTLRGLGLWLPERAAAQQRCLYVDSGRFGVEDDRAGVQAE